MFLQIRNMKLQHKIALLSIAIMAIALTVTGLLVFNNTVQRVEKDTANKALVIARIVANIPAVRDAILSANPSEVLQPAAENWRQSTGAAFIVISNMQEVRLSHPITSRIGTSGFDLLHEPVLRGQEYVYSARDTLAPSLRATVPIFASTGQQIGFVSVGYYLEHINLLTMEAAQDLLLAFLVALLCSLLGAFILAKHVTAATFGLEPYEIATILKEQIATLEVIREGLVAVDINKRIKLLNNEAAKLLGVTDQEMIGHSIDEILPQNQLNTVMASGMAIYDEEQQLQDNIILSNSVPIKLDDKVVGAVVSFRDRTEINRLAEELTGIHRLVDTLRAQAHEFKNKMHTVAGLIQLKCYQEAMHFAIGNKISVQEQIDLLRTKIKDSVIFGLLLGKESQIKESGIEFTVDENSYLAELPVHVTSGDLILIIGNLLQNSMEAVAECEQKSIWIRIWQDTEVLRIKVRNSGPKIDEDLVVSMYRPGVTTKPNGNGLGLALIREKLDLIRGSITSNNLSNGGVEFEVCIPYNWGGEHE